MASMRDIKRRRDSIQSTEQITKAMKLVSTAKLQKAKAAAEQSRPYYDLMYDTICSILRKSGNTGFQYKMPGSSGKSAVIAVTSNRGLAGGYNSNIVKLVLGNQTLGPDSTVIYPVGRKGRDAFSGKGFEIGEDFSEALNGPSREMAARLAERLLTEFDAGRIKEVYVAYTAFQNTVTQVPRLVRLLPVESGTSHAEVHDKAECPVLMNYEPDEAAVLEAMMPHYLKGFLYGALLEAAASENGARMTAMDAATSNAEEMIEELGLLYNRARQGSITQELTEIIAGAGAIS